MFVAARFIGPKLPLEESIRSNLILQKYSRNKKSWMKGLAHVEYLLSQKLWEKENVLLSCGSIGFPVEKKSVGANNERYIFISRSGKYILISKSAI